MERGLPVRRGRLKVGILGGSFNPAHGGHLKISLEALRRLKLDEVWWLVALQNPLKSETGMLPLDQRLAGAKTLVNHPRIRILALEQQWGVRYSIDTVRALHRHYPGYHFVFLIGADNLAQFPAWRRWAAIFSQLPIAVFRRPPYSLRALNGRAARRFARYRIPESAASCLVNQTPPAWVFLGGPNYWLSSTALRQRGRHESQSKE